MPTPTPPPPPLPPAAGPSPHYAETILWTGRRSQWFYLGHWLLGLVLAAGLGVAIFHYRFRPELARWLPWAYGVPLLFVLLVAAYVHFERTARRYRITNYRVISETGRVIKDSNEIRLRDIRNINVHKAGFTGLLGIGRVEFSSAASDDADVVFYQIGGADRVRDLVHRLQTEV